LASCAPLGFVGQPCCGRTSQLCGITHDVSCPGSEQRIAELAMVVVMGTEEDRY
jgi:hypothetical protein